MTDQRTVDRVLAHLRSHVAELRRLERDGARPEEVEERRRVIDRLRRSLAYAVEDLVTGASAATRPPGLAQ